MNRNTYADSGMEPCSIFRSTPYRLLKRIGEGGMGSVFLVCHRATQSECVAKVIHDHLVPDEKTCDRFRLEAQTLGALNHPHIVSARDAGLTADGRPYLAMEYLHGKTLAQVLREETFSVLTALETARQLLLALDAAHGAGVVHRDLKPSNLFLVDNPDGPRTVKVLDFGLAKVLPRAPRGAPAPLLAPTTTGTIVGTPRYMSPEAASGREVDERADVYAAALVLYKMLTGRDAFGYDQTERILVAQLQEAPCPPSRWTQSVSQRLDAVVLRALSKNPKGRFRTARDFMDALLDCKEDWGELDAMAKPPPWTKGRLVSLFLGMFSVGLASAFLLRSIGFG